MDTAKVIMVADRLQQIAAELSTLQQHCLLIGTGEDSPYHVVVTCREQITKAAQVMRQVSRTEAGGLTFT